MSEAMKVIVHDSRHFNGMPALDQRAIQLGAALEDALDACDQLFGVG